MSKTAHAFAAFRRALITECNVAIETVILPSFIAEAMDIDREYAIAVAKAEEVANGRENALETLQRLADQRRNSRRLDLVERRKRDIAALRESFDRRIKERIVNYGGTVDNNSVVFPDASSAQLAKTLFVDYTPFKQW